MIRGKSNHMQKLREEARVKERQSLKSLQVRCFFVQNLENYWKFNYRAMQFLLFVIEIKTRPNVMLYSFEIRVSLQYLTKEMVLFQRKKKYSRISYEKRLLLIQLVQTENMAITKASKKLHIKLPTAKVILRNYRHEGKILLKKVHAQPNQIKIQDNESSSSQQILSAPLGSSLEEAVGEVGIEVPFPSYFYYPQMVWYIL